MTLGHNSATIIANALGRARVEARKCAPTELNAPASAEDAYLIQSILNEAHGPAGGFKVSRKPGEAVTMAPIYARDILPSPAIFDLSGESEVGIELELGFKILAPLPAQDEPEYDRRLRDCVALVPVIEIVLTRIAELKDAPPLLRLADNQLNGGLVVGPELRDWTDFDTTSVRAHLCLGNEIVLDDMAAVPGGDAWENFRALVNLVGSHCGGLHPGQIVTTGSLNGLPWVSAGTPVRAEIYGLGRIEVKFLC